MTSLEVEHKYSLSPSKYLGCWNINKDIGKITFYLNSLWNSARRHSDVYEDDHMDLCIENFIEDVIYLDLIERVCLERAHEKIRMKGRTRCEPNCCVRRSVLMMLYPERWESIRQCNPINEKEK